MKVYYDKETGEVKGYEVYNSSKKEIESASIGFIETNQFNKDKTVNIYNYKVDKRDSQLKPKKARELKDLELKAAKKNMLARLDAQYGLINKKTDIIFSEFKKRKEMGIGTNDLDDSYDVAKREFIGATTKREEIKRLINSEENIKNLKEIRLLDKDADGNVCKYR
jgi:hypothetical protein